MNRIFNRLSLMAKVALAPAWVLLCLLIVTAYTVWAAQATSRTLDFLTQQSLAHVTLVAQAQERAVAVNAMVMQSVAYAGIGMKPSAIRALDEKIGSELKATQKRLDRLRETLSTDSESFQFHINRVIMTNSIYYEFRHGQNCTRGRSSR